MKLASLKNHVALEVTVIMAPAPTTLGTWFENQLYYAGGSTPPAAHSPLELIDTNPFADEGDPMDANWSDWYQLHYYDVVTWLLTALVVLCAVNLCVTVRQRQQAQYVVVKHFDPENERDVEAMPMVQ